MLGLLLNVCVIKELIKALDSPELCRSDSRLDAPGRLDMFGKVGRFDVLGKVFDKLTVGVPFITLFAMFEKEPVFIYFKL